ncbi:hypothetical protein U9M48_042337 [Paspalum notatum var. saurae]|uniref:Uncharacterized protein n=1 Tax=Paspalum notatum var. saurae TaxID=547442 RepID=A0AAQ3UR80_PASNO
MDLMERPHRADFLFVEDGQSNGKDDTGKEQKPAGPKNDQPAIKQPKPGARTTIRTRGLPEDCSMPGRTERSWRNRCTIL